MNKYTEFSGSLSFMNPLSKYRFQAEQPKFEMQARSLYRDFQSIDESSLSPNERENIRRISICNARPYRNHF